MKLESKNRVYKLTGNRTPLSCIIPSRNSKSTPLLYFDEDKGYNRALRYARNAQSPFEDEQKGQVILEPIIFDNGMLSLLRGSDGTKYNVNTSALLAGLAGSPDTTI